MRSLIARPIFSLLALVCCLAPMAHAKSQEREDFPWSGTLRAHRDSIRAARDEVRLEPEMRTRLQAYFDGAIVWEMSCGGTGVSSNAPLHGDFEQISDEQQLHEFRMMLLYAGERAAGDDRVAYCNARMGALESDQHYERESGHSTYWKPFFMSVVTHQMIPSEHPEGLAPYFLDLAMALEDSMQRPARSDASNQARSADLQACLDQTLEMHRELAMALYNVAYLALELQGPGITPEQLLEEVIALRPRDPLLSQRMAARRRQYLRDSYEIGTAAGLVARIYNDELFGPEDRDQAIPLALDKLRTWRRFPAQAVGLGGLVAELVEQDFRYMPDGTRALAQQALGALILWCRNEVSSCFDSSVGGSARFVRLGAGLAAELGMSEQDQANERAVVERLASFAEQESPGPEYDRLNRYGEE